FLDDIVIYCADARALDDQLIALQHVLDQRHLSLNDAKTIIGDRPIHFREPDLDDMRRTLVRKRELMKVGYDDEDDDETEDEEGLTEPEREYLVAQVQRPNVAQEDIELALSLMRHEDDALELLLVPVLDLAPHLLRGLHRFIGVAGATDGVWHAVRERIV